MRNNSMSQWFLAIICVVLPVKAWAEVSWENDNLEFSPTLADAEVRGEFTHELARPPIPDGR